MRGDTHGLSHKCDAMIGYTKAQKILQKDILEDV